MRNGKLNVLMVLFFLPVFVAAQVTTSSISGTIRSANEVLAGATVKATHEPTGTAYITSSLNGGVFNIVNMIPGGPYKIEVSYVGYQNHIQDNEFLALGENTRVDVNLSSAATGLTEVIVSGSSPARRRDGGVYQYQQADNSSPAKLEQIYPGLYTTHTTGKWKLIWWRE